MEMRIAESLVHPTYIEDGKEYLFTTGTDIAFAVAEIPLDKWRAVPQADKEEFQRIMDEIPVPAMFEPEKQLKNKDGVAVVAGYPMSTLNVNASGGLLNPPSEHFIWADFGHIQARSLVYGSTLLCYGATNLVTSAGQSGSAL
jgi:hypothetical protein